MSPQLYPVTFPTCTVGRKEDASALLPGRLGVPTGPWRLRPRCLRHRPAASSKAQRHIPGSTLGRGLGAPCTPGCSLCPFSLHRRVHVLLLGPLPQPQLVRGPARRQRRLDLPLHLQGARAYRQYTYMQVRLPSVLSPLQFGSAAADRVPRRRPCCRSFCRCSAWMWVLVLAGLLLVALPTMVALKLQGWTVLSEASWAVTLLPLWYVMMPQF